MQLARRGKPLPARHGAWRGHESQPAGAAAAADSTNRNVGIIISVTAAQDAQLPVLLRVTSKTQVILAFYDQ